MFYIHVLLLSFINRCTFPKIIWMTNGWKWTTSNEGSNVSSYSNFRWCYSYVLYLNNLWKKEKVNITLESSFKVSEQIFGVASSLKYFVWIHKYIFANKDAEIQRAMILLSCKYVLLRLRCELERFFPTFKGFMKYNSFILSNHPTCYSFLED